MNIKAPGNIDEAFKKLSLFTIAASSTLSLLIFTTPATASTFNFSQKLTAPDGATGDFFSRSVAIDENYALIGSFNDNDNGTDSGSAYLFDITSGSLLKKFTAFDGAALDQFGVSVAIDENYALIGSYADDDKGADSGSAYLFDTTSGSLLQKFTAPDGAAGNWFGISAAIEENYALIGSFGDGSAYLFDTTSGSQLQKFTPPGGAGDLFGFSVAIDGDRVLIGSRGDDDSGTDSGSAYLFDKITGSLLKKFTAPDGSAGDLFGFSVAIDGNNALIGSYLDDDNGTNSGSAYLFDTTSGSLLQKFTAPDGAANDVFGHSVAIDGNRALIGSVSDNDNGTNSGSAYLFDIATGSLLQKITAPDGAALDQFGFSVAFDGDRALIGAANGDGNETNSGSAYLFTAESVPEPSSTLGLLALAIWGAGSALLRKLKQLKSACKVTSGLQ
ncbi:MAG: FG-GAP repeat protein [Xenococcaceae cyanobacterium]